MKIKWPSLRFGKAAKKQGHVGLDIGTCSIKVAEVLKVADKYRLLKYGIKDITDGQGQGIPDAIKSLLDETAITPKELNISFSGSNVVVRFIPMPIMQIEVLRNAMKFECEKYIPFSIDEVYVDCCILKEKIAAKGQMLVLLAVVKKKLVDDKIEMLKEKGFDVSVVDIDTFAVFNAFTVSQKDMDKTKSIALINMGGSRTNVLISKGDVPYFTRDIQMGGQDLDNAISKQLGIELNEAAKLKIEPKKKTKELIEASKNVLNSVIDEIKLSSGYYENQFGEKVSGAYLSGGLARMPGLADYMEQNLGMKPVIWDPLLGFELDPGIDSSGLEKVKSKLAISVGMALRS